MKKVQRKLCVALVQQSCGTDKAANLEASIKRIREAAAEGANLVVLQELHASRYFCQVEDPSYFDLAEEIPGESTEAIGAVAAELGIVIVASLFERRAAGLYHNTAVVLERDGSITGIYRKMHIPDDPAYYEKFYFTPGDIGFEPIDTSVGRLGVLVCWDQWYPEAARLMAMAGAEMLIYPTAIGWDRTEPTDDQARQRQAWELSMRGHAVANGLPVLCANRTGFEPNPQGEGGLDFWGGSFVAGPQGEILAQATADDETVLIVDIDLARSEEVRRMWPFLRDRRIDMYEEILLRYRDQ
ncbi:MAG TPA: carbon-nitrogen hydrolase [Mariprofundaceae bacterium]|nr:carbon-nitrogen hydrolase [Mariprofundaceae bacterium]